MPPKKNQNVDMNRSQSAPPHPGDSSRLSEQEPFPYPNIRGLTKAYPDVDPYRKYCRVDMDHARDMNQIRTYMQLLGQPNKRIVETILNSEGFKELEQKMEPYCQEIWKLRNERKENEAFTKEMNKLSDPAINLMEQCMTAMQKMVGVPGNYGVLRNYEGPGANSKTTLTVREVDLIKGIVPGLELTDQIKTETNVPRSEPRELQILPSNMKSIVQHMFVQEIITELNALGHSVRTPQMAHMDQKTFEERAIRYAAPVVRDVLNAIYTYREEKDKETYQTTERDSKGINRGTWVLVNGKSIAQWMREEYEADRRRALFEESQRELAHDLSDLGGFEMLDAKAKKIVVEHVDVDEEKYQEWYAEKLDKMSVKRVLSALMEGGSVKARVGQLGRQFIELKMDGLLWGMDRLAQQDAAQRTKDMSAQEQAARDQEREAQRKHEEKMAPQQDKQKGGDSHGKNSAQAAISRSGQDAPPVQKSDSETTVTERVQTRIWDQKQKKYSSPEQKKSPSPKPGGRPMGPR